MVLAIDLVARRALATYWLNTQPLDVLHQHHLAFVKTSTLAMASVIAPMALVAPPSLVQLFLLKAHIVRLQLQLIRSRGDGSR